MRLALIALLIPLAVQALPAPPTLLACAPDDVHRWAVSRDAAGTPLQVSVSIAAGARECDFLSAGAPKALSDGGWRFEWDDKFIGQHQRVDVKRVGADGYTVALEPAGCGALKLPATATLTTAGKGCTVSVDRNGAFAQFWSQLRDALARGDGELLQQLSLPQLEFIEGPDIVKAPSSVMRRAARCLPRVTATTQRLEIRDMIAGDTPPRLDMPPLSLRGEGRIDFGGAMDLKWTPQGWRMAGFNASRDVFSACPVR
ncbi:MAG TPA: hypothetical protein VIN03_25295 [Roseateles sp.]